MMKKELEKAIEKYRNSSTSLEAYQAISDFIKIIITVPEFIEQVEKEGERIRNAQIEINADKGWNYGLRGKELDEHNKRRARKHDALHQLDPIFPLRNLHDIHLGIQSENIANDSDWLFFRFSPDDPMPAADKNEYQEFMDKLYKKILPFLTVDSLETLEKPNCAQQLDNHKPANQNWEEISIRFLNEYDVEIKKKEEQYKTDYEQMGFADNRKKLSEATKAKESWNFLYLFSSNNGVFPLDRLSSKEREKRKKQKQELSKLLKAYFKIDSDPILYDGQNYQMKIKLIPDATFQDQWADKDIMDDSQ